MVLRYRFQHFIEPEGHKDAPVQVRLELHDPVAPQPVRERDADRPVGYRPRHQNHDEVGERNDAVHCLRMGLPHEILTVVKYAYYYSSAGPRIWAAGYRRWSHGRGRRCCVLRVSI